MIRFIIGVFGLFFFCLEGVTQKAKDWEKYILIKDAQRKVLASDYTIISVDKSVRSSTIKKSGIEWYRRFDEGVYLISNDHDLSQVQFLKDHWTANNLWKLAGKENIDEIVKENLVFIQTISNDIASLSVKYPVESVDIPKRIYKVKGPTYQMIKEFLDSPLIVAISAKTGEPRVESRVIDLNLNPNYINKLHAYFPWLDGSTQVVSIQEERFDPEDQDLIGRTVFSDLESSNQSDHATEMATIIAGAGNTFVTGLGVATQANITSSGFSNALPDADEDYLDLGINVQNHSYGTGVESFYGIQARAFDQSSHDNPYLLHVFSSGNVGNIISSEGSYAGINGYANLTGNFKMAKNLLVIGAVDTTFQEVMLSSRGPAYDGRIKPELVAYSMAGSSNSAALVSGVSTLLQEDFQNQTGQKMPSALLKALLINSARDAGTPGVDHVSGFGSVDAYQALKTIQSDSYWGDTISTSERKTFSFNLPPESKNLKVTLCWTDPAAEVDNFKALVNDLDMKLVTPGLDSLNPWVLSTEADSLALAQPAKRGEDHLNNVEQISLDSPDPGSYTIIVDGYDIPDPDQPFCVVFDWNAAEEFEWDFPTKVDNMPYNGETATYFRWRSTFNEESALLRYRIVDEGDWVVLDDNVSLPDGYWRWENIPDIYSEAIAQMIFGGQIFTSDTFTISRPLETSVGFSCGDSLLIQWEPIAGASAYEISTLNDEEMVLLASTRDTFLIIDKSSLLTSFLAVQGFTENDKPLIQGYTFDYELQGAGCFLISFFQELSLEDGIYLNLNLTTNYGIQRVIFERLAGDNPGIVSVIDQPGSDRVRVLDDTPNQGYNEHRVTIQMLNGQEITATASNAYYLTKKALLVFPNPIHRSQFLNIYTRELENDRPVFRLFDRKGSEVLRYTMFGTQEAVELDKLRSGLYFYRLEDTKKSYKGKLIIR